MAELEQKKLSELRVVDLKVELEKRDIDVAGVKLKAVLLKKLSKALTDEGNDPDKFIFHVDPKGGTPLKRKKEENGKEQGEERTDPCKNDSQEKRSEDAKSKTQEAEENVDEDEELTRLLQGDEKNDETESAVDFKVKDEGKTSDEDNSTERKESEIRKKDAEEAAEESSDSLNTSIVKEEPKQELKGKDEEAKNKEVVEKETRSVSVEEKPNDSGNVDNVKIKGEVENDEPDKDVDESVEEGEISKEDKDDDEMCYDDIDLIKTMEGETDVKEDKSDINGLDAEDSIHLTIGEDEEKLMAGEDDLLEKKDLKEERSSSGRGSKKQESSSSSRKSGDPRHISPDKGADDKGKKSNYKNLWVSGLSSVTRATDLKQVFSKLGKVVAAKVVTNAKTPGARCYGFVTMATSEDAQNCIKGLNLTELHGRLISVEAVANKPNANAKKPEEKRKPESPQHRRADEKKRIKGTEALVPPGTEESRPENGANVVPSEETAAENLSAITVRPSSAAGGGGDGSEKGGSSRSSRRASERDRHDHSRTHSRDHRRPRGEHLHSEPGVLSFEQIKEERERQRRREKDRAMREEERRHREERDRHRAIEMRQREETIRLEREREKLRIERERLERERVELLRFERERLEREKEDLKRQQLKLEEARRNKRTLSNTRDAYDDRKRVATEDSRRRYESEHVSSHSMRYPERSSSSAAPYRSSRDDRERRGDESHRTKSDTSRVSHRDRYDPPSKSEHRYGSESWMPGGSSSVSKGYGSHAASSSGGRGDVGSSWSGISGDRKGPELSSSHWSRSAAPSERWVSGSGGTAMVGSSSSGSRGASGLLPHPPVGPSSMMGGPMSMGSMSSYPQSTGDRFDAYKPMGSMSRKY